MSGPSRGAEFAAGVRYLVRGLGMIARRPKLFGLGLIPPAVTSTLLITLIVVLAFQLDTITLALSGWAPAGFVDVIRFAIGALVLIVAVLLAVIIFSGLTLLIGSPIYEKISESVEAECGGVRGGIVEESLGASAARSIGQSLTLVIISVGLAVPVFVLGLIPAVGGIIGAIASALVGGTMITLELIGGPFDRRGRRGLGEKHRAISALRARSLGFGIPVFLLFSLPLVAVIAFPAATAGGTLLARHLAGEPDAPAPGPAQPSRG